MWVYIGTSELKNVYIGEYDFAKYQEVERIQTTWTQWIDTLLFPSNNIQIETKVEVTQTAQDKPVFWSVSVGSGSGSLSAYYHLTCYNSKWYYWLNNVEWNAGTYSPTVWTQYTVVYNWENSWLYINGSNIATLTWTVWASSSTLGISYRWWTSWTANRKWQYKYFYFKMYDKSTSQYVRDFVPCYRKSDNVIWMYDFINNQFYTNAWTGTFTKWPDVN